MRMPELRKASSRSRCSSVGRSKSVRVKVPVDGLLDRIGGQYAKRDGDARFRLHLRQTTGGMAGDVVEVGRVAANHGAQCDDGVVLLRIRQGLYRDRQFPRSRHVRHWH